MTIRDRISSYIKGVTNEKIDDHSTNLFENGLLTSLDVLDIISFIENAYDFEVSGDDVDMDSFGSIDGIVNLVERVKGIA